MNPAKRQLNTFLSLFILGISSQVIQAWMVREILVVFYGNELSLGAIFGSWLLWIALGSLAVIWLRDWRWVRDPTLGLSAILMTLPLLLLVQVVAVRGVRRLLDTPSLDRAHDDGRLANHRNWWGMSGRPISGDLDAGSRSITEMIFVPDSLPDGLYWLNLELQPLVADAVASRPVLYPLEEQQ